MGTTQIQDVCRGHPRCKLSSIWVHGRGPTSLLLDPLLPLNLSGLEPESVVSDDRYQAEIPGESERYGDILQGGFRDSPYENTRKFMLALDWVNKNLPHCKPRFILKTQVKIRVHSQDC